MARVNRIGRFAVLLVALVAAVGLGLGPLAADLCAAGGSFADDPGSPVCVSEYALPLRAQSARPSAVSAVASLDAAATGSKLFSVAPVSGETAIARSSNPNPRRC